ncbi:MAG: hypothetical protein ACI31S_02720 [Bacilli bacterium]
MNQENNFNKPMNFDPQTGASINAKKKKGGFKNFWIYVLFNFIFGFLLPLLVVILDVVWVNIQENKTATTLQAIVFLIEAIVLLSINEFLVCKVAKKAANSTYLLSKFAFVFNCITILFITYLMFMPISMYMLYQTKFVVEWTLICIGLIGTKLISYILAKKLALKEKLEHKGLLFGGFGIYILLIFIIFNLFIPSGINKFLFNIFGNTDFSSKELKIYLTETYATNCGNVSYFDDFTDEELKCFDDIIFDNQKFTTEDLSKLKYLNRLEIDNTTFDNQIDFSKNNELVYLKINNSTINNLDSQILGNINRMGLTKVNVNTINIEDGNLEKLYIEESKIEDFKVQGTVIEEIDATKATIKTLEVSNTTKLDTLEIEDSQVESVLLDNNIALENREYGSYSRVRIDKINSLELKNVKNLNNLLYNSYFTFKNIKFLEDKGFKLENNNYLKLESSTLYVPEKTKVKELILENMTAIVIDRYHELISCDGTGTCTYDAEEKTKVQGPDSTLGDTIELYDNSNNQLFKWTVLDYEEGEL